MLIRDVSHKLYTTNCNKCCPNPFRTPCIHMYVSVPEPLPNTMYSHVCECPRTPSEHHVFTCMWVSPNPFRTPCIHMYVSVPEPLPNTMYSHVCECPRTPSEHHVFTFPSLPFPPIFQPRSAHNAHRYTATTPTSLFWFLTSLITSGIPWLPIAPRTRIAGLFFDVWPRLHCMKEHAAIRTSALCTTREGKRNRLIFYFSLWVLGHGLAFLDIAMVAWGWLGAHRKCG